jgi:hypothetical protein
MIPNFTTADGNTCCEVKILIQLGKPNIYAK